MVEHSCDILIAVFLMKHIFLEKTCYGRRSNAGLPIWKDHFVPNTIWKDHFVPNTRQVFLIVHLSDHVNSGTTAN